jgi:hypothetical protein
MKTATGPEHDAATSWDRNLDLSVGLFGRRVELVVQWREGPAIRRVLLGFLSITTATFVYQWSLDHSATLAALHMAADTAIALLLVFAVHRRKWAKRTSAWFSASSSRPFNTGWRTSRTLPGPRSTRS